MYMITKNNKYSSRPYMVSYSKCLETKTKELNTEEVDRVKEYELEDHPSAFVNKNGDIIMSEYAVETQDGDFIGVWAVADVEQMIASGMVTVV